MMLNITPPSALQGDEQAQLKQIYRYLFRLSETLNATAATLDSQAEKATEAVAKAAGIEPTEISADVSDQYTALVSLVVKTANIVQSQMDKIVTTLRSEYKAQSEWGELTEEVIRVIEDTAKHTIENYKYGSEILNIPEMAADFEAYKIEAEGYIKRGIIGYDDDGYPILGIAIGQELKSREVTIGGVAYTEFDTTKNMATYTADKLSFWVNGVEVAYLSNSELVVTRIIVSDSIQLGDWDIKVNAQDGLTIQQRIGNEIVTASQINMVADQIDLSGNKSIKLTAEQINAVADDIDLSGNTSIKLTAEQVNAVAGQIDLSANKSIVMVAGKADEANAKADNLDRLSNIEVIEGTFAQTERREGEGIRIYSEIVPKQDLKWGDPYPGGGGKNLCELVYPDGGAVTENADGTATVTNNNTGEISGAKCVLTGVLPAGTYTISKYDSNVNVFLQTSSSDYSNNVVTHTFNYDGASFLRVVCSNIKAGESVTYKIQIEKGSAATSYAPYANICPIEGRADLNAGRSGVQLLDDTELSGIVLAASHRCDNPFKVVGTYTVSINITGGTEQGITFALRHATGSIKQYTVQNGKPALIEVTEDILQRLDHVMLYTWSGSVGATLDWIMVNAGSTALPYAPYQGNTYSLDFGETVYGGTVDWDKGEAVVDEVMRVYDGSPDEAWEVQSTNATGYRRFRIIPGDALPNTVAGNKAYVLSNMYKATSPNGTYLKTTGIAINQNEIIVYDNDRAAMTADEWKAWLSENPLQVSYKLATPRTIQFSPVRPVTLDGVNTVYTDADGGRVEFGYDPLVNTVNDLKGDVNAVRQAANDALPRVDFQRVVRLDDEGLHVGDNQTSNEVLIDSDSVNVVMGGQKYSRFTADYVQFGDYQLRKSADGGLVFKL